MSPELKINSPLAVIVAVCLILWGLPVLRSCSLYEDGVHALDRRMFLKAITSFERSGLYYAPFNSFPEKSVAALLKMEKESVPGKSGFSIQAGKAATRVLNQTAPWRVSPAVYGRHSARKTFPGKSFTLYAFTHISFCGWLSFTILFFFRGFDKTGAFIPGPGRSMLFMALLSLGSWFFLIRYF